MNKQKVLDKLDEIHDIYEQVTDPSDWGTNEYELFDEINDIAESIQKEVNSKIKMPKVFDDWYKNDSTYGDPNTLKFKIIHFTVMAIWGGKGIESQERLCDWIKKAHKGKYTYDEERFVRCIEAIIHGYEVEE